MTIVRAKEETMALQDTITLLLQCMRFVENKRNANQFKGKDYFPSTEKN